jgi:D-alanyl-D-alanine carboxypeptidase
MNAMHCPDRRIRHTLLATVILTCTSLAGTPALAATPAPDAGAATDCLFNWLEGQYPALYAPPGATSMIRDGYYYRDYSSTGTRLAAGTGRVWLLAPGAVDLAEAGPLSVWLAQSGCQTSDTTPPTVLYTSRGNGAVDVVRNARVTAALSEPVQQSGLAEALTLTRDDGQRVHGTVSYDAAEATLSFDPASDLAPNRGYTATLAATVRDLAGNPLTTPYSWQFRTTSGTRRNTEVQQQLQFVLDRALWRYVIPGGTMAILNGDGSLWSAAAGYSDITTRSAMTEDLLLRIGSNTKTYVATAVLRLVDAGKVNLDAPINTYLANEMRNYLPNYDGNLITVRQLLQHTSGIVNFTTDAEWGAAFISDPTKRYFPQELLLIANRNVTPATVVPPGQFSYSNTNYVLLGLLLGNVGPYVYDDAIRLDITTPLGLANTLVPAIGDAVPPPLTSRGYWEDTETGLLHDVTIKDPSTVWSSGDMIADVADLARWGQALGRGTLISPASQAARLTYVDMTDNLQYGLGIVRDRSANLLGHQGGIIGYTSQTYYVPDESATVAFFYNRTLDLHDYSVVMTYDALKLLWPERYRWLTWNAVETTTAPARAQSLAAGTPTTSQPAAPARGRPGFLTEY